MTASHDNRLWLNLCAFDHSYAKNVWLVLFSNQSLDTAAGCTPDPPVCRSSLPFQVWVELHVSSHNRTRRPPWRLPTERCLFLAVDVLLSFSSTSSSSHSNERLVAAADVVYEAPVWHRRTRVRPIGAMERSHTPARVDTFNPLTPTVAMWVQP